MEPIVENSFSLLIFLVQKGLELDSDSFALSERRKMFSSSVGLGCLGISSVFKRILALF